MLTLEHLDERVDNLFSAARRDMLEVGTVPEAVVLLNGEGAGLVIANLTALPLRAAPERMAGQIREHRAVAAAHLSQFTAVAVARPALAGGGTEIPQHLKHLLMSMGYWPARGYCRVRAAQVVQHGDVMDLAELDEPSIPLHHWLAELLPRH
ncbi:hypothetical protein ACIBF1_19345 [Spirillospora sp. NPDC050679]